MATPHLTTSDSPDSVSTTLRSASCARSRRATIDVSYLADTTGVPHYVGTNQSLLHAE